MAVDDTAPRAQRPGPIALADLFDAALKDLAPKSSSGAPASLPAPTPTPPTSGDAFLFSGNRHESVPRRLFLDRRLTPLERNAWQVFRLMLNDDGVTAFPTYEQLRPWLASMPCAGQASHETVARALTLLRLTRWLSLVRRRRDPKTGRILGNLYVLHDEPLTPFEAMQLDADYLALVSQSLGHSAKAVQVVDSTPSRRSRTTRCCPDAPCRRGCKCSPSAWPTRASPPPKVIHRRMRSTIPKKGPRAFFGMAIAHLRNPKQGRNPRQTALFGIRSRTVQYVVVVLMKYVLPRRRVRWATCNGPSASRN